MNHDLNIQSYSLEELFELLDLPSLTPTLNQMMSAKRKVMRFHPDKSPHLSPDYFRFYKSAYELVETYYKQQNKMNRNWNEDDIRYHPIETETDLTTTIMKQCSSIEPSKNHRLFNEAFEAVQHKPTKVKNAWFYETEPLYTLPGQVTPKTMNKAFQDIKQQKQASSMIIRPEIQALDTNAGAMIDDYFDNANESQYITSYPFSKLKYDDIRKVHKDQTVFAVSETDYEKQPHYSLEEYNRIRTEEVKPWTREQSELHFEQRRTEEHRKYLQREYKSQKHTKENEKRVREVSSYLLQLEPSSF